MDMQPTHAMILAAGLGMRMRPLTEHCPKPLIEVNDRPLIDYSIEWLAKAGIDQLVVNTHYLPEQIEQHVARQSNVSIQISHEAERLETGGGIKRALPMLGDQPFIVVNSDAFCIDRAGQSSLQRMAEQWNPQEHDLMLLLYPTSEAIGYHGTGDFIRNSEGQVRRVTSGESGEFVFTGVQLLTHALFDDMPDGAFTMNDIYNRFQTQEGWFDRIGFIIHEGDWLHVGDPDGLEDAQHYFLKQEACVS